MDNEQPPVTSYSVYHNVTSPDDHVTINNTHYSVDILRGFNYYFIVSASNVLGEGDNTTLYGMTSIIITTHCLLFSEHTNHYIIYYNS